MMLVQRPPEDFRPNRDRKGAVLTSLARTASSRARLRQTTIQRRAGISLLEVLIALAIFFLSIVAISQMVDQASRTGQKAARLTKAGMLADAAMAELLAGVRPLSSSQEQLQDSEEGWMLTIQATPESWAQLPDGIGTGYGLHQVHVTVAWHNPAGVPEAEFTLSRVMLDPALKQSLTTGIPTATGSGGSSSSSSSTGTGGTP